MTDLPLITPCATFDEWKRLRGTYIGGSDAAAILGLSPYRSPGEVWIEKVQARDRLDSGDVATLNALLDRDSPQFLLKRGDLWLHGSRTVTLARRP